MLPKILNPVSANDLVRLGKKRDENLNKVSISILKKKQCLKKLLIYMYFIKNLKI